MVCVSISGALQAGGTAGAQLGARLAKYESAARAARGPAARSEAARADAASRALLAYLQRLYRWLDAPPLRDLDSLSEVTNLSSSTFTSVKKFR